MRSLAYLTKESDLEVLQTADELILEAAELARFGKLNAEQVNQLAKEAKVRGKKVLLEWDVLVLQDRFSTCLETIDKIDLTQIDAVRAQDPGVIHWLLTHTSLPIQLNLETGHHNLLAIETWVKKIGQRLDRIILSIEWSKSDLKIIRDKISAPIELLVMGRILLFYSPRYLLNVGLPQSEQAIEMGTTKHWLEACGQSEESPHKGFPLIENKHGTFMFLPKDHCLLDSLDSLEELEINFLRVDNRFMEAELLNLAFDQLLNPQIEKMKKIKATSSAKLIRGFFNTNKSDILFKKLKNHRIQRVDENYVGQVVDVNKKNYIAIKLKNPKEPVELGKALSIATPEGKKRELVVKSLQNSRGEDLDSASGEMIVYTNHVTGVSVKASAYFNHV